MAIVQYQVLYKYVNPVTKNTVSNKTSFGYEDELKFIKDYRESESATQTKDTIEQGEITNPKYDMVFVYGGVESYNDYFKNKFIINESSSTGRENITVIGDTFRRAKGEVWFVSSTHASLKSALNSARTMVLALGKEAVSVVKKVPLEVRVGIE